eukprot:15464024-Alexandrium_andersonii.AAC.2
MPRSFPAELSVECPPPAVSSVNCRSARLPRWRFASPARLAASQATPWRWPCSPMISSSSSGFAPQLNRPA